MDFFPRTFLQLCFYGYRIHEEGDVSNCQIYTNDVKLVRFMHETKDCDMRRRKQGRVNKTERRKRRSSRGKHATYRDAKREQNRVTLSGTA